MIASRLWCVGAALVTMLACPTSLAAQQRLAEAGQGKKVFEGLCVLCHGSDGAGGEAPSINRPNLERAPDNSALRTLITNGISNRMPAVRHLSENELGQLVDYVRSLGRAPSTSTEGNARNGGQIYQRVGCASCHMIDGQGGSLGPVLTEVGSTRGSVYLRQAIVDPGAALPRGTMAVPARDLSEFLPVRVMTREGREVRGFRVNEDTLTIQLRDSSNRFHSFRKADLRALEKQTGASLMPSYKDRLTAAELGDLVSYLSSLRGAR